MNFAYLPKSPKINYHAVMLQLRWFNNVSYDKIHIFFFVIHENDYDGNSMMMTMMIILMMII